MLAWRHSELVLLVQCNKIQTLHSKRHSIKMWLDLCWIKSLFVFSHLLICCHGYPLYCPYTQLYAECDAVNGVGWDFSIRFLPTDPEDHKGVGWDGGGGAQGFTQPAMRSTLVHFNCYLQSRKRKLKRKHRFKLFLDFQDFSRDHDPD